MSIGKIVSWKGLVIGLFLVVSLGASIQALVMKPKANPNTGIEYTRYNNYVIFKSSFIHLMDGKDMYVWYEQEHWDLFKYTPTFAVLFGGLAVLPDWLGLTLWNLLNTFVLLAAVYLLPNLNQKKKAILLLIVVVELLTSLQNEQSNGLMAGLLIMTFALQERNKTALATLCIMLSVFIKLFGIVGFVLFLFYPAKWKAALFSLLWAIVLFLIPLLFIDYQQYLFQLESYRNMLLNDHSTSFGYSVMGWLHTWFGASSHKLFTVMIGAILFMLPFVRVKSYGNYYFRLQALASVLIWVVIFNHKAESPTFVIAMAGVALWFVVGKYSLSHLVLLSIALILTSLSPTDFFLSSIRNEIINPYTLKAIPCIFVWATVVVEMLLQKNSKQNQLSEKLL